MPETCAAIVIAAKHGELIKVRDYSGITDTIGALRCKFEFRTNDWDNATMTAVFCKGNMATNPEIVDGAIGVLLDSIDECAVPAEVLTRDAKYFSVGVWGVTAAGFRIVSKWLVFRIEDGCYVDATEPIEPTPTVYEQIMSALSLKASINHEHNDLYYTKTELDEIIDDIQPDSNKELIEQVDANTKARHTHSNNQVLNKFSEDNKGNPLYNGKAIVSELEETDPTVPSWAKQPKKPSYTATEVGALPNTTKIPSTTSDLTNNSGFITKVVDDLANYYLKSETYTQAEINQKISTIPKFSIAVVDKLPTENISNTTIYLLKDTEFNNNLYTEYIYISDAWETLGSQQVDMTNYRKSDELVPASEVSYTHSDLIDKSGTMKGALDEAINSMHTHDNQGVLDILTPEVMAEFDNTVSKRHEHDNKNALDGLQWVGKYLGYEPYGGGVPVTLAGVNDIPANMTVGDVQTAWNGGSLKGFSFLGCEGLAKLIELIKQNLSSIPKFDIAVVDTLPTENISNTTVYLVRLSEEEANEDINDFFKEYIHVNGTWELLGSQKIYEFDWIEPEQPPLAGDSSSGSSFVVEVEEIEGGHRVSITTASGTQSFDVLDGAKGEKGDPFTYDDFTPEQLEALKGADGKTPIKGTDYFTEQDKSELVDAVLARLPKAEEDDF